MRPQHTAAAGSASVRDRSAFCYRSAPPRRTPMRRALKWSVRLLLLLLLLLALLIAHTIWFKPLQIGWFFERVFIEYAVKNPEMLSGMRMLPSWMDWYSDDLADASLQAEAQMSAKLKRDLETLRSYDRAKLD